MADSLEAAEPADVVMAVDFPFPGVTGSPLHCQAIASGFTDQGHRPVVMKYVARTAEDVEHDSWNSIPIIRFPRSKRWRTLWRVARENPRAALYAHGLVSAALLLPLRVVLRRPLTIEFHSVWSASGVHTRRERLTEWAVRAAGAEVIVLSRRERDELVRRRVARRERIHVMYPPIEVGEYRRAARGVRADQPVVLYVGNFMPYQGVDLLLEAFGIVAASHPTVRMRIAGGVADDVLDRLSALPAEARERIEFLGRIPADTTRTEYENADVLVIPRPDLPINNTTARKLGEYMASGRLVVATDVADHRYLLDDAGLVCAPDAQAFAAALATALDPSTDTESLALRAQQVAEAEFSLAEGIRRRIAVVTRQPGFRQV